MFPARRTRRFHPLSVMLVTTLITAARAQDSLDPETADVQLSIGRAMARSGERVALDLRLLTETELSGLTIAINFDEQALIFEEAVPPRTEEGEFLPDAVAFAQESNNLDSTPGDQTTEGWVYLEIEPPTGKSGAIQANAAATPLLTLYFRLRRSAPLGYFARVGFEEIGPVLIDESPRLIDSSARLADVEVDQPRQLEDEDVDGGGVEVEGVIGEVGFFLRGDANMDCRRDISDAVAILNYLYTGGAELLCPDAADSDDNSVLELNDPVFVLNYLFREGSSFPEPLDELQEDPTRDYLLFCEGGFADRHGCGAADFGRTR